MNDRVDSNNTSRRSNRKRATRPVRPVPHNPHLFRAAPVHAGAAREREGLDLVKARKLQQARRRLHIGVHVHERVLNGGPHPGASGHVDNPLHALRLEDAGDERGVAQVALKELHPVRAVLLEEHRYVRALGGDVVVAVDLGVARDGKQSVTKEDTTLTTNEKLEMSEVDS